MRYLDIADPGWSALISVHPDATIFHHPVWVSLLADCYGYRALVLSEVSADGEVAGALPLVGVTSPLTGRRIVALPFSDLCPPLTTDCDVLEPFVDGVQRWRREQDWPEVHVHWPLPEGPGTYVGATFLRHITHLAPDPGQVCRRFRPSVPRLIRQAEKSGVAVKWGTTWDDLRIFYRLHEETRRRQGTPVQPLRFFRLLWQRLLSQGLGFLLLAYQDSQPLAGAVFLHWNRVLTYKYGASDPAYWHLRPNNLLFWHAIRWGCENGYQSFDWGRTEKGNEGLRDFKRGWGSDEYLLHYSILADRPPGKSPGERGHHLLAMLIRHSPPWVCRAIGELLYGHFA